MRIDKPLAAVLTASALLAGGVAVAQSGSGQQLQGQQNAPQPAGMQQRQQQTPQSARQGQAAQAPMTMRQVIDRVEQAGYRDIREVEREDGGWEVYATDSQGRRAELYVDGGGRIRLDE